MSTKLNYWCWLWIFIGLSPHLITHSKTDWRYFRSLDCWTFFNPQETCWCDQIRLEFQYSRKEIYKLLQFVRVQLWHKCVFCTVVFLSNNTFPPPLHRTEAAALNMSFSCYWAPFAVCGAASCEVAGPCAPSIASVLALRAQMWIYSTRSSCLYWHHSTTQPWCFQPSTWCAAVCHYTLIKMLDMKGGRLAFFHFCLSPQCGKQHSCAKLYVIGS